jgi:transcriptional regulator GlxA family with amidase domain
LTTAVIAGHHRVTPRYIQKLFAEERTTFTHYILKQRLERAPLAARSLLRRPKRHIDSL